MPKSSGPRLPGLQGDLMLLGAGEYERGLPESFSTRCTRLRFLEVVSRIEPHVMSELRNGPFGLYYEFAKKHVEKFTERTALLDSYLSTINELKEKKEYFVRGFSLANPWKPVKNKWEREYLLNKSPLWNQAISMHEAAIEARKSVLDVLSSWEQVLSCGEATKIREGLWIWARDHNLDADWCRDHAIKAMQLWLYDQEARERSLWANDYDQFLAFFCPAHYLEGSLDICCLVPPPLGLDTWWVNSQTRKHYLDSIDGLPELVRTLIAIAAEGPADTINLLLQIERTHFDSLVKQGARERANEYCDEVARFYDSLPGWKRVKTKPMLIEHLYWTVLFQIRQCEYKEIGEAYAERSDNVRMQVGKMLSLIGLPKRAGLPRGRPKLSEQEKIRLSSTA